MLRRAIRPERSPSRPRIEISKSDGNLTRKIPRKDPPKTEEHSTYRSCSWRAALLPEVDYRYQMLRIQGLADTRLPQSKRFISRLSLLSNSPQKKWKLSCQRSSVQTQLGSNSSFRGPMASWATLAAQSQVGAKKHQSQISTNIISSTEGKPQLVENGEDQRLGYLTEEVKYLRSKFLRHYERHHSEIMAVIQEDETALQPRTDCHDEFQKDASTQDTHPE